MNDNTVTASSSRRWFKRLLMAGAATVVLVPVAGYVALSSLDLTRLTAYLQKEVKEKTGRDLTIDGGMDIAFGLSPTLSVKQVALSNPSWAEHQALFSADEVTVQLDLLPLLHRELAIQQVSTSGAKLALEKSAKGSASWEFKKPKAKAEEVKEEKAETKAKAEKDVPAFTTRIGPVELTDTELLYKDHAGGKPLALTVPHLSLATQGGVKLDADLALNGFTGTLKLEGAPLEEVTEKPIALNFSMQGKQGAEVTVDGKIKNITATPELYLDAKAEADTLAAFGALTGSALPETEALYLKTTVSGSPKELTMETLEGALGEAEATGKARVSLTGDRPSLSATLNVSSYKVPHTSSSTPAEKAAGEKAPAPAAPTAGKRVLPDIAFPAGALDALNADVEFTVGEIVSKKQRFDSVMGHLVLKEGILQADPVQFKLEDHLIKGRIAYNTSVKPAALTLRFSTEGQNLGAFLHALDLTQKMEGGVFSGEVSLKGRGGNLYAMLPNLEGHVSAVVENAVLKYPKLQEASELSNLLQGKNRSGDVHLTCALGKLDVTGGIGKPDYLVADTKNVRLTGEGSIDLPQELLALTFYPQPKKPGLSELSFPVKIKGSFANPSIKPDRTQAAFSIGKMFSNSKKLRGLEGLLGKKDGASEKDMSGIHPCLTPIETPQEEGAPASAKDVLDVKKEDVKKGIKDVEQDVRGLRDGLKGLFKK